MTDDPGQPNVSTKHRRSALETFDGCPYRFEVLYELCRNCGHRQDRHHGHDCDGEGDQSCMCVGFAHNEDRGDESQRGIAFHEAAFRYIDRLAKAGMSSDAEEASLAFREGVALSQVPAKMVNQVKRLWDRHTRHFQLDLDAYFAAESQQITHFCLACQWRGEESEVVLKGSGSPTDPVLPCCPKCSGPVSGFTWIPDLVYLRPGVVSIIDWKTYYKGLTADQARNEFQAKYYLWQAMNLWPGFERYEFTFNFPRLGYEVTISETPEQIEEFSDEIKGITLSIYEARRTRNYPAIPGSHCSLCRLKCPVADNRFRLPVRINTPEERDATAGRILVLEQELKQLKKILKSHCATDGGFIHKGQIFAFWPEKERRFPADQVLTWFKERGIDVSHVTLSADALGHLANTKKAPTAHLTFLDSVKVETEGWTFRHRKAGGDLPAGLVLEDVLGGVEE